MLRDSMAQGKEELEKEEAGNIVKGSAKFRNGRLVKLDKTKQLQKMMSKKKDHSKRISVSEFLSMIDEIDITTKKDKYGLITVKQGKNVLTYLTDAKYGVGFYVRNNGSWRVEKLTTERELLEKATKIKKDHENKSLIEASLSPVFKCAFCDFETTTKQNMLEHLNEH